MCVSNNGKVSKSSSDNNFSLESMLNEYIFPDVIKKYLIGNSISRSQKVISYNEMKRLNKKFLNKVDSEYIQLNLKKVWNAIIPLDLINKFKFFINSPLDLIKLNKGIHDFKSNKISFNDSLLSIIKDHLYNNNILEVYNLVGNLFGLHHIGKELFDYLDIKSLLNK